MTRWLIKNKDFEDDTLFAYLKRAFDEQLFGCNPALSKYISKKFFSTEQVVFTNKGETIKVPKTIIDKLRPPKMKVENQLRSSALMIPSFANNSSSIHATMSNIQTNQGGLDLLRFSESEVAEQLTLIEYELVKRIEPRELLKQTWNKRTEQAQHVVEYIQWFNKICQWAATEIIKEETPEQRAYMITKFIMIANVHHSRNFFCFHTHYTSLFNA